MEFQKQSRAFRGRRIFLRSLATVCIPLFCTESRSRLRSRQKIMSVKSTTFRARISIPVNSNPQIPRNVNCQPLDSSDKSSRSDYMLVCSDRYIQGLSRVNRLSVIPFRLLAHMPRERRHTPKWAPPMDAGLVPVIPVSGSFSVTSLANAQKMITGKRGIVDRPKLDWTACCLVSQVVESNWVLLLGTVLYILCLFYQFLYL